MKEISADSMESGEIKPIAANKKEAKSGPPPMQSFCQFEISAKKIQKAVVIVNPFSGNKRGPKALAAVRPVFEEAGVRLDVIETERPRHGTEILREMDTTGFDVVCLIGGDGTFCEALEGYFARAPENRPVLGLIPGGTGNSLCLSMGCADPVEAAKRIVAGRCRSIDVVKVLSGAEKKEMYMLNMMGWGLGVDANIMAEKLRFLKKKRYDVGALVEVFRNRKRECVMTLDGEKVSGEISMIIAQNNQHCGVAMRMAPYARVDDGLIDIVYCYRIKSTKMLKWFGQMKKQGAHVFNPHTHYSRAKEVTIECESPVPVNIDGENCAMTPVVLTTMPQALPILN